MKKYLMTGIAALTVCAGFTNCSNNEVEVLTPAQIDKAKYDQAFLNYVGGTIAADQDWGFSASPSSSRMTRAINVNGNLWEETPECTAAEAQLVFNYVNMTRAQMKAAGHKYTEVFPKNIANYFVTQVYTGTDTYSTFDGTSTGILGSSHMDHLNIAMNNTGKIENGALEGKWEHINNFNASSNMNYGGNTLVVDGGTLDFAYNCSEDSRYHNKWIAINGADVDASLAGKYYVCFDFIAENPDAYTQFRFKVPGNNAGEWTEKGPFKVPGCWTVESATAANLEISYSEWVWDGNQSVEKTKTVIVGSEGTKEWKIDNVVGGNMVIPANDVYTDWIVRIVEAQRAEEEITYDIRILGEDLSAQEAGDFDFNDVVLDVKFGNPAQLCLRAAGGTLPLRIAGNDAWEVHGLFGVGTGTMVNTQNGKHTVKAPVALELNKNIADAAAAKSIKLEVFKNNTWQELTATIAEPAAKIAVPVEGDWLDERTSIKEVKTGFVEWATQNKSRSTWWTGE